MARSFLYEVLVRGGPDGLVGAHQVRATVDDSGEMRLGPPTPLAPADVSQLLGEQFATLATDYSAARARISELEGRDAAMEPASSSLAFPAFMSVFTADEQATLVNSADSQVKLFLLEAAGAGEVNLASDRVAGALDYLVSKALLAPARKAEIIAGSTPA